MPDQRRRRSSRYRRSRLWRKSRRPSRSLHIMGDVGLNLLREVVRKRDVIELVGLILPVLERIFEEGDDSVGLRLVPGLLGKEDKGACRKWIGLGARRIGHDQVEVLGVLPIRGRGGGGT